MQTFPMTTACWRGYVCSYCIKNENLYLENLHIGLLSEPVPLGGSLDYENLELPIQYDGEILLGAGFISERYVHMGFQSPSAFQTVFHLTFRDGKLVERTKLYNDSLIPMTRGKPTPQVDLMEWINDRFSLRMDMR